MCSDTVELLIGKKYDQKERITEFREQANVYFLDKFQSSQKNIKELLFDQFGLTDKKISEYAKITNGKLDEISDQNIYIIQQFRAIKKFMTSGSNVSEKQTIPEKSPSENSVPTSNKNEGEHSQSSQHPHVENNVQDITEPPQRVSSRPPPQYHNSRPPTQYHNGKAIETGMILFIDRVAADFFG